MKFSLNTLKDTFSNMKAVTQKISPTYNNWEWGRVRPRKEFLETKDIEDIIRSGNTEQIIALSKFYFNTNGLYRRILTYFSTMPLYETLVLPHFTSTNLKINKSAFTKNFSKVLNFIDESNLEEEFARIFTIMLVEGVYYGLIYDTPGGGIVFGDLPRKFCRTRFRSNNGNQILEFNVQYFDTIKTDEERELILNNFPSHVRDYYHQYINNTVTTSWYLCPEEYGVAFTCSLDGNSSTYTIPFFIQTIPAISRLRDYEAADLDAVQNELNKLIINKIPLDKDNELAFELPEVEELHKGIVGMLSDNKHVDVITTFCDTEVASLGSTSDAVRNDLGIVTNLVYNEAGVSKQLFNNDSAISITYSVQNDLSLVCTLLRPIERWMAFKINDSFSKTGEYFYKFSILPISHYNRDEMIKTYLEGAQYGYSKFLAGSALGIHQSDLISLTMIENEILQLDARMIPLQSSHTMSGDELASIQQTDSSSSGDIEGDAPSKDMGGDGRPEKKVEDLSPSTIEKRGG